MLQMMPPKIYTSDGPGEKLSFLWKIRYEEWFQFVNYSSSYYIFMKIFNIKGNFELYSCLWETCIPLVDIYILTVILPVV